MRMNLAKANHTKLLGLKTEAPFFNYTWIFIPSSPYKSHWHTCDSLATPNRCFVSFRSAIHLETTSTEVEIFNPCPLTTFYPKKQMPSYIYIYIIYPLTLRSILPRVGLPMGLWHLHNNQGPAFSPRVPPTRRERMGSEAEKGKEWALDSAAGTDPGRDETRSGRKVYLLGGSSQLVSG